jgi:hypothetical protein
MPARSGHFSMTLVSAGSALSAPCDSGAGVAAGVTLSVRGVHPVSHGVPSGQTIQEERHVSP